MPQMIQTRQESRLSLACEVLRASGKLRLQAFGTSMAPCIWPGEVLTVQAMRANDLHIGDVVLFARNHRFFIHRIVARQGSSWITRGDAVPQNDPPVPIAEILGKVVGIERNGRVVPPRRASDVDRVLAWLLCHSDLVRNLALRLRAVPSSRPPEGAASVESQLVRAFTS